MPASHREQLIDGAIQCLQTKGFARTTARDIAAASGANLASIGYHFGSKEALLSEALIRVFEERNRHVATATFASEAASPLERLSAAFVAVRAIFEEHRPLLVAFVEAMAETQHSPALRQSIAAHYRQGRVAIGAWIRAVVEAAGGQLGNDAEIMASFLMATLDGLVLQWLLEPSDTPAGDDLVHALAATMAIVLAGEG
jgi:AcrR family transcriptional regulator